jgi:hypothetical protein
MIWQCNVHFLREEKEKEKVALEYEDNYSSARNA